MKSGMLHPFENPAGRSEQQMIREPLSLMESAEDYGFDSLGPAEQEFADLVIWYFRTFGKFVAPKLGQPPVLLGWTRLGGLPDDLVTAPMQRMRDTIMPSLR